MRAMGKSLERTQRRTRTLPALHQFSLYVVYRTGACIHWALYAVSVTVPNNGERCELNS